MVPIIRVWKGLQSKEKKMMGKIRKERMDSDGQKVKERIENDWQKKLKKEERMMGEKVKERTENDLQKIKERKNGE